MASELYIDMYIFLEGVSCVLQDVENFIIIIITIIIINN